MALKLVTRAQWGARKPRGSYSSLSSTRGAKVHYTGGNVNTAMVADHSRCAAAVRGIQNGHMDGNGWIDIGYSMAVCYHGYVFVGRGPHHLPAANGKGLNSGHYAVLGLVGNSGLVVPSDAMLDGIRDAIDYLRSKGNAGKEIKGHRDGYATDCPGPKLYAWVKAGAPRPNTPAPTPEPPKPPPQPGTAPKWPGRVLTLKSPMMTGTDVRAWQTRMHARGWDIATDAVYGKQSRAVCEAFQDEKGLDVDGKVGPDTWKAAWETPVT